MKKILAASLLCLLPSLGFNQSLVQNNNVEIQMDIFCGGDDLLNKIMFKYEEEPLISLGSIRKISGEVVRFPSILFMNTRTGTWSIVEERGKEFYCVISVGDNGSLIINEKEKRKYY